MAEEPEELTEDKEAEDEEEIGEARGGISKILIIGGIVLAVVCVLAGGVWLGYTLFFSSGGLFAGGEEESQESEEATEVFDPENPPGILDFTDAFLIRLHRDRGAMSPDVYLKLNIAMEVESAEVQAEMQNNQVIMSRISDTINTFLASKRPSEVENRNWAELKQELINRINEKFPEKYHIKRINFKSFLTQPR